MPEYLYTDNAGHLQNVTHSMTYNGQITCDICTAVMWRKPQPFRVSWGGLAPSAGGIPALAQELNETRAEREERYRRAKDERG